MSAVKTWRESELIMTLGSLKEKAAEYRKAVPILKDADLSKAAKTMSDHLEAVGKQIRRLDKELDRRATERGPQNMADAFRL